MDFKFIYVKVTAADPPCFISRLATPAMTPSGDRALEGLFKQTQTPYPF